MASYTIDIPDIGEVKVTKKRGMRSIRIRITADGKTVVSAPHSVPKTLIKSFINSKKTWIIANSSSDNVEITNGLKFGRNLTLYIHENNQSNRFQLISNDLHIYIKGVLDQNDTLQKQYIEKKVHLAMTSEAENLLLPMLLEISKQTNISFNQAYVKKVISKWGSCDQSKNIILNTYLTQIDDKLIRYVIIHELCHTLHLNHSKEFWAKVSELLPSYKIYRKALRLEKPSFKAR